MSLKQRIRQAVAWMRNAITQPRSELTRWEHAARFAYDLGRHGGRQLRQDNAPQMAGALAFRTLFGLLPVLVVGTLLVRAMASGDQFESMLISILERMFHAPVVPGSETLPAWILSMEQQAQSLDLTGLGFMGVSLLVYSAIGLMTTIEETFNRIYRAPEGRTWFRRLPVYWTLLTLGPMALGVLVFVNTRFDSLVTSMEAWNWVAWSVRGLWSTFVMWLLMLALYRLMPAKSVALRPAMVGALVSTLLLGMGQQFLGAYLVNMQSIKLLGSVGLIPLFMFWVYLMWLGVLFGLEVAATLQRLHGRRKVDTELETGHNVVDPVAVLPLMEQVSEGFGSGRPTTREELAEELSLGGRTVDALLEGLLEAGFLHRVDGNQEAVTLARPPEAIGVDGLLAVGHRIARTGTPEGRSSLLTRLREAEVAMAEGMTLAEARAGGTA